MTAEITTPALFGLRGKVAILTGGNGGIGLGMARGLAAVGADIAVIGRSDPVRGEVPVAYVELREGQTFDEMSIRCAKSP